MEKATASLFVTRATAWQYLVSALACLLPCAVLAWCMSRPEPDWGALAVYPFIQVPLSLLIIQMLTGLPWRLLMRAHGAPLSQIGAEELGRRLDLACQYCALALPHKALPLYIEAAFSGTLPGRSIKLRLKCYDIGTPKTFLDETDPKLAAHLNRIIFGADDPRAFTRYATFHHWLLRGLVDVRPSAERQQLREDTLRSHLSHKLPLTQHQRVKMLGSLEAAGVPVL